MWINSSKKYHTSLDEEPMSRLGYERQGSVPQSSTRHTPNWKHPVFPAHGTDQHGHEPNRQLACGTLYIRMLLSAQSRIQGLAPVSERFQCSRNCIPMLAYTASVSYRLTSSEHHISLCCNCSPVRMPMFIRYSKNNLEMLLLAHVEANKRLHLMFGMSRSTLTSHCRR